MYERLHVNAKVERSSNFALPLFYLGAKNVPAYAS